MNLTKRKPKATATAEKSITPPNWEAYVQDKLVVANNIIAELDQQELYLVMHPKTAGSDESRD